MKKSHKVLLILLILIAVIAGVCSWQRNNIQAMFLFLQNSQDEITTQMQDNQQKVVDTAQKVPGVTVHGLTDEQKQALKNNAISREELIQQMIAGSGTTASTAPSTEPSQEPSSEVPPSQDVVQQPEQMPSPDQPSPSPQPEQSVPSEPTVSEPAPEVTEPVVDPDREQLAKYIAEIYLMQTEYTTWLEDMNQAAIEEFVALPDEERTTKAKYSIGLRYMGIALEKEKECDARMAELEASIKELLTKLGEDTALVDEIHATYLEEKKLKKAYYLGLH